MKQLVTNPDADDSYVVAWRNGRLELLTINVLEQPAVGDTFNFESDQKTSLVVKTFDEEQVNLLDGLSLMGHGEALTEMFRIELPAGLIL